MVQRRAVDWLRIEHGRLGTLRYESVVLSLDAPVRNADGEPLSDALAGQDVAGFDESAVARIDMVGALTVR